MIKVQFCNAINIQGNLKKNKNSKNSKKCKINERPSQTTNFSLSPIILDLKLRF